MSEIRQTGSREGVVIDPETSEALIDAALDARKYHVEGQPDMIITAIPPKEQDLPRSREPFYISLGITAIRFFEDGSAMIRGRTPMPENGWVRIDTSRNQHEQATITVIAPPATAGEEPAAPDEQ